MGRSINRSLEHKIRDREFDRFWDKPYTMQINAKIIAVKQFLSRIKDEIDQRFDEAHNGTKNVTNSSHAIALAPIIEAPSIKA